MIGHKITRRFKGSGESSTIQPVCSCGWEGKSIPAWDDYQLTKVRSQISEHYLSITEPTKLPEGHVIRNYEPE